MKGKIVVAISAVAVVAAGCSSSSSPKASASATTAAPAAASSSSSDAWALSYLGGKSGAASGTPIVIGWGNEDTGVNPYPDETLGAQAAVKEINSHLGGIDGHPLQLSTCDITDNESAQKCGVQFAGDPSIQVVATGIVEGVSGPLYTAINNAKPILVGQPFTASDLFIGQKDPNAFTYGYTANIGIPSTAVFAGKYLKPRPKAALVITDDDPAGRGLVNSILTPALQHEGITTKAVFVPDGADAPQVLSALQAGNIGNVDLVLPVVPGAQCADVYTDLKQLNAKAAVVDSGGCINPQMTAALKSAGQAGPLPVGWYSPDGGISAYVPSEASAGGYSYIEGVINGYAAGKTYVQSFAVGGFSEIFELAKMLNGLGSASPTAQQISTAMLSFTATPIGAASPAACRSIPVYPTLCTDQVGFVQVTANGVVRVVGPGTANPLINPFAAS